MSELDFPSSPSPGQVYTGAEGLNWVWDGQKWRTGDSLVPLGFGQAVYAQPFSGATIVATPGQGSFQLAPAAPLIALSVRLPPGEWEGQVFEVATSRDIDAVVVIPTIGDSVFETQGNLGTLAAGGGFSFRYRSNTRTWYRVR